SGNNGRPVRLRYWDFANLVLLSGTVVLNNNLWYTYTVYVYCLGGSILVRATDSQDGAKNPLKGISMKSLVLASLAQIGVGAGG
ncbi:MAG: hypothetical protein RSA70_03445, partial [Clostridia bacterium]